MDKKEFIKRRTEIISNMLDNPDDIGIFPTSKCFKELDALFGSLTSELRKTTEELKRALNCVIQFPVDEFDEEDQDWVVQYKMAHEEMLVEKENKVIISEIDLTKQTISLGTNEQGPLVSLMKGHVDALTFVKAFRAEGWNSELPEPTEEEWKQLAEDEKSNIEHDYGRIDLVKNICHWNLSKTDEGVEPVTLKHW